MYAYNPAYYFQAGEIAVRAMRTALELAGTVPRRILDLPCGYGRVLRRLKVEFPDSELVGCELREDAVQFCRETFDVPCAVSSRDPATLNLGTFDLVWSGSLLTHVPQGTWVEFLRMFERSLNPGGVLVFTTFGRAAAEGRVRANDKPFSFTDTEAVMAEYDQYGFAFRDTMVPGHWGDTLVKPSWVCDRIAETSLRMLMFYESGWGLDGGKWSQDIIACVRSPTS